MDKMAVCRIPDRRLVLAAAADRESLVLDVGAAFVAFCNQSSLGSDERAGFCLLFPVLVGASLFRNSTYRHGLHRPEVLRLCRNLAGICPLVRRLDCNLSRADCASQSINRV